MSINVENVLKLTAVMGKSGFSTKRFAMLFWIPPGSPYLKLVGQYPVYSKCHEIPLGSGSIIGTVAITRQQRVVDSVSKGQNYFSAWGKTKSQVTLPVLYRAGRVGIVQGVLNVESEKRADFDLKNVEHLKNIVDLITPELTKLTRKSVPSDFLEILLEETEEDWGEIRKIFGKIVSVSGFIARCQAITDEVARHFDPEGNDIGVYISTYNKTSDRLTTVTLAGKPYKNEIPDFQFKNYSINDKSIMGLLVRTYLETSSVSPYLTNNVRDPREKHYLPIFKSTGSQLTAILAHDELLGCLTIESLTRHKFVIRDVRFIERLVSEISLCLAHSRVQELASERMDTLRKLENFIMIMITPDLIHQLNAIIAWTVSKIRMFQGKLKEKNVPISEEPYRSFFGIPTEIFYRLNGINVQMKTRELQIKPDKKSLNIIEILYQAIRAQFSTISEDGVKVIHKDTYQKIPCISADKELISKVFDNIIVNALKAMKDIKGGIILFEVKMSEYENREAVEITIENSVGKPIPRGSEEDIFNFIKKTSISQEGVGTQLGLPYARYIVREVHEGKIWAEEKLRKGAKFHIKLPVLGRGEE